MTEREDQPVYLEAFLELLGEAQRDLSPPLLREVLLKVKAEIQEVLNEAH